MVQRSDRRTSSPSRKLKKGTKPTPSSQALAKQYFYLLCLRQKVKIAESGKVDGRELTKSPMLSMFA
jgi:hypothetical protein